MITENQMDYILALYEEVNMEANIEYIEELTKPEASELIQELLEIKNEMG